MKVAISHRKTISITVPTVKPTLNTVPKFTAQSLISTDDGNQLTTGTDGLLYTTHHHADPLAHYILAKS